MEDWVYELVTDRTFMRVLDGLSPEDERMTRVSGDGRDGASAVRLNLGKRQSKDMSRDDHGTI
jgi:hypothetical protein